MRYEISNINLGSFTKPHDSPFRLGTKRDLATVICGFLSPRNVQKLRGGGQDYAILDNFS